MNINAAFVGGGNMGGALIRGLIARGLSPQQISVGEAHQQRRIALADELGVHVTADNREAVASADVVVLAVKPQDMAGTVQALADVFAQRQPLVLSIAAGIRVADIVSWCGPGVAVVRAMPNRPALNSAGATAMFAPASLSDAHRGLAADVLGAVGTTEAALRSFDSANLRGIVAAAISAAADRSRELAQAFGKKKQP